MSFGGPAIDWGFDAGTTGVGQYRVVRASTNDDVVRGATGTGGFVIGVLQDDPTSTSQVGQVRIFGISKVLTSSKAVEVSNMLVATTAGLVQPATASSAQYIFGMALETAAASTVAGRLISMAILHNGRGNP